MGIRRSILDAVASDIDAAIWLSACDDVKTAGLLLLLHSDDLVVSSNQAQRHNETGAYCIECTFSSPCLYDDTIASALCQFV